MALATPREDVPDEQFDNAGWTHTWIKAMLPDSLGAEEPIFRKRNIDQAGYRLLSKTVIMALGDAGQHSGIYEWAAKQPHGELKVVYVGSTCRSKRGKLKDRILEYCNSGSHKHPLINDALVKGYELFLRVKPSANQVGAEREENELLAKYNYAWNVRNNGAVRQILPSPVSAALQ